MCALVSIGAPRAAAADDTLTVMGGSIALSLGDVLDVVADRAGFYKQQHLNIVEQLVNSPSAAAQLVASGKGDICGLSDEAILQGYEKGVRLQYFLLKAPRLSNVLGVLDDSPIHSLADFKGKNIGVFNYGSAGEVTGQLILEGAGLQKNDVNYIPIGVGPQALQAILSKKVDAIAFPYAEIVQMELLANFHMRVFRHPILKDVPAAGFAATPATIQNKADALRRYARAIVEAAVFVHENRAGAARMFLEASGVRFTDADVQRKAREFGLLQDDLPYVDPRTGKIGAVSTAKLQLYAQALADYGMTGAVIPASAVVTNQFVDYANDFDHQTVIALAKNWHASAR
jgi:NitT/TauT family transport system substrate-binding protein